MAHAERVQVQLVSFEASEDASQASRNREREKIWCTEFSNLQAFLGESGTILNIESALPIGAKPLKRVTRRLDSFGGNKRPKRENQIFSLKANE